jgi:Ca2+-binding RTX toxin-like protein
LTYIKVRKAARPENGAGPSNGSALDGSRCGNRPMSEGPKHGQIEAAEVEYADDEAERELAEVALATAREPPRARGEEQAQLHLEAEADDPSLALVHTGSRLTSQQVVEGLLHEASPVLEKLQAAEAAEGAPSFAIAPASVEAPAASAPPGAEPLTAFEAAARLPEEFPPSAAESRPVLPLPPAAEVPPAPAAAVVADEAIRPQAIAGAEPPAAHAPEEEVIEELLGGAEAASTPNAPPVAAADTLAGAEDGALTFRLADLLANDSDRDGDGLSLVGFTQPAAGALAYDAATQTFTFTPPAGWSGATSFTYTIGDGRGGTDSATVDLDLEGVADDPRLRASLGTGTHVGSTTRYPLAIQAAVADADGSETISSIVVGGLPAGATLTAGTDNGDGTWTLAPAQLDNLRLNVSDALTENFNLSVSATAREADGDTETSSLHFHVPIVDDLNAPAASPPGDWTWVGRQQADDYAGGPGDDVMSGRGGADVLGGGGGDDYIDAGTGSDTVGGGVGDDTLVGGSGNDVLRGDEGSDTLAGDAGRDTLAGGAGDDALYGGADSDALSGGEGNDALYGGDAADTLAGDAGDDTLFGGAGNDMMSGGEGNDVFEGGLGDDRAAGGVGDDMFVFGAGDGRDHFDGGAGWSDTVLLENVSGGPDGESGWTLQVDGDTPYAETANGLEFHEAASGTITLDDGSVLTFENLEKIAW